ncbi:hypothetical protein FOJ82_06635 [Tessaracoccus rhinocerotis]|uniref:DUF2568 domain-containing protein n=1 Tax=Tessaracoccus rhinocerotis TaxID=1689449 RepID=A0A553K273_9ACTN|nr:hypothetical protein [Tessaracoccus rhinocerotis]TRY18785.1 hypothetical protein FOJ82_06635 [Tessaracoccus rhinocerotis]
MSELRWYAIVLFLGQLALLGLGAWSLWRIAGGWWLGAVVAALFVVAYGLCWALLLAPGSSRRLSYKERLTVHCVLGPAIVVLASLAGLWLPALVALSTTVMCDALNEKSRTVASLP